jgi:hypothetical protein
MGILENTEISYKLYPAVCAVTLVFKAVCKHWSSDFWCDSNCNFQPVFKANSQNCEKQPFASSCLSAWNNSPPTGRSFMKFCIWVFFENLSRKFKFHSNLSRITDTLHEVLCTFVIISRSVLLRMRNISDKSCRENQSTHFMFSNLFFRKSCRLWDNVGKRCRARQARDENVIRRMRFACWITKSTNTLRICNTYCFFDGNSGYANARQCYVVRILSWFNYVVHFSIPVWVLLTLGPENPVSVFAINKAGFEREVDCKNSFI